MNEKKWTDDERDEAFDRGMETMQRVALELYRRGREPLLEELEEARARNADMRAMLEQVTRDRDHVEESLVRLEAQRDEARADAERYLADLRRCASEPYERTRELEALQAEVERLRETNDYLRTWLSSEELEGLRVKAAEHPLLWEEIHHLKAEVERLRMMLPVHPSSLTDACTDAYRRGAEAMREACAQWAQGFCFRADDVRALPIPEEP